MNLAAQWLSENKMKIVDIALELGYSNASKFAKAFQSVYGMLPKDYRKINRKNGLFSASSQRNGAEKIAQADIMSWCGWFMLTHQLFI